MVFHDNILYTCNPLRYRNHINWYKPLFKYLGHTPHYFGFICQYFFIATQTLIIFFFVGTGVNVKEYTQANQDIGDKFYKGILGIKRKLYPPTLMVTILFMIMVILDGGFFLGKVKEWWFHIVYVLTLYYYTKATGAQHKAFIGSTNIVLAMTKTERQ